MGSDAESDPYPLPKLPLFSMSPPHISEPSGTSTPPLQTSASVPFRWEEQPGKPRLCTDLIIAATYTRTLELPPRLAMVESSNIITKTSSPTTVLDGKSVFSSSSFRFPKERRRRGHMQGSFDSSCSGGWSPNDDNCGGGQLMDDKHDHLINVGASHRRFGSFRLKSRSVKPKGSVVISPSSSSTDAGFSDEKMDETMRRNSSLSKVTRSHFWATIYEGFKQVVPWRKKNKKENFIL